MKMLNTSFSEYLALCMFLLSSPKKVINSGIRVGQKYREVRLGKLVCNNPFGAKGRTSEPENILPSDKKNLPIGRNFSF